jgi:hypothetical protein
VGFDGAALAKGFAVVAVSMALMLALSVRMVNNYASACRSRGRRAARR